MRTLTLLACLALVPTLAIAAPANAPDPAPPAALRVDLELDPLAYAFDGFSLHVGLGWDHYRLDLGTFAARLPAFAGQDGFDASFSGFGLKLDHVGRPDGMGLALGLEAALLHERVERPDTGRGQTDLGATLGARIGYRLPLGEHFFVLPWVGAGVHLGPEAVVLDGATYDRARFYVFPTVHLGYRLP